MVSLTSDQYRAHLSKSKKVSPSPVAEAALVECVMPATPSTDEERLNKTEKAYLAHLRAHGFRWIGIQSLTLKLGDDCRYSPDFITISISGELTAREVKGFFRDDAKVKIKVAARMFPWIKFIVVRKDKSGWTHEPMKP